MPTDKLPQLVRAAATLRSTIEANLFPPQELLQVNVQPGESTIVRITVGKKP
jgi:hypothetical protein